MYRCLELAKRGAGYVAPNPLVGAVLVYNERIIGEGWHQQFGEAHAEVNCIASVKEEVDHLISQSTLYVSLEPCAHFGKTPPCTDLIIQHKISKVIIGCRDPFKEVNGKGIERLKAAGVDVEVGIEETLCKELNKRFFTFQTMHRPYIILKWAETADGKMAPPPPARGALDSEYGKDIFFFEDSKAPPAEGFGEASLAGNRVITKIGNEVRGGGRLQISNEYSNRLVHQWRSEEAAILIGTNTAMLDNPELTTRWWPGKSPIRLIVDLDLKLPAKLKIFNHQVRTIIFNTIKQEEDENLLYYRVTSDENSIHQIMNVLYQLKIQSVIVEGGAKLLQSFIDQGIWDEARIIKNEELIINNGLTAPVLKDAKKIFEQKFLSDLIEVYELKHS